jgi:hypothetical protein
VLAPVVIEAGVHDPGLMRRHADRVLPVHELIVVQAGVLPIEEGDRRFEVGRDEWVLLRAGRRHRGYDDLSGDTWFYWICFGDRSLEDEEVAALFAGSRTGRVARRDRVRALLVDLVEDQESAVLTPSTARSYLQLIAAEILLDPPAASRSAVNDVVRRAAGYISEHLTERELSTARVAAALAFDPD